MPYVSQKQIRDKQIVLQSVEARRRDAGGFDCIFFGLDDDGSDLHVYLPNPKFYKLVDDKLYDVKLIGGGV